MSANYFLCTVKGKAIRASLLAEHDGWRAGFQEHLSEHFRRQSQTKPAGISAILMVSASVSAQ